MADDTAEWKRIKALFCDAIELHGESRGAFLERLADADRQAVAQLIVHHDAAYTIAPAAGLDVPVDGVGRRIGPFRLVGLIGQGGRASVYLAERDDGSFDQRVAIKLLATRFRSEEASAQFRREQQALARLSHPNIARLYDGGLTEDGLGYVVMELVEGVSLSEHARTIGLDAKLALFQTLCAAVSHAHANLFLHRDLKPGNILVTAQGELKLLDFGLAHSLDAAGEQAREARMLTPAYASPEHFQGNAVSVAADVWSLGVILFELATDRRPFATDGVAIADAERAVREAEPPRPSALAKLPRPRDFDAIVARALAKAPGDRTPSAAALAEDVAAYRSFRPVAARPGARIHRAMLFLRRNRLAAAAAGLVLLVSGAGVASTLYQAERADRRFQQVRALANAVLNEYQARLELLPGATEIRRRMIADSLAYLDGLAAEAGDDPELMMEASFAYEQIGDIQGNDYTQNLGRTADAFVSYRKSLALRQALYRGAPGNAEYARQLSIAWGRLGDLEHASGQPTRALEQYQAGLGVIAPFARGKPELGIQRQLARKHLEIATVLGWPSFSNLGRTAEALTHAENGVAIAEASLTANRRDVTTRWAVLPQRNLQAMMLIATGRYREARAALHRGLALAREWLAEDPGNGFALDSQNIAIEKLAELDMLEGRTAEGVRALAARMVATRSDWNADKANARARRAVMVVAQKLAAAELAVGNNRAALAAAGEAVAAAEALVRESDRAESRQDLIDAGIVHAAALAAVDRGAALARYAALSAMLERLPNPDRANVRLLVFRAELEAGWSDAAASRAEAGPHRDRAIAIYSRLAAGDPANVAHRRALARLYARRGAPEDRQRARSILETLRVAGTLLPADRQLAGSLAS